MTERKHCDFFHINKYKHPKTFILILCFVIEKAININCFFYINQLYIKHSWHQH